MRSPNRDYRKAAQPTESEKPPMRSPSIDSLHRAGVYLGKDALKITRAFGGKNLGELCLKKLFTESGDQLSSVVREAGFSEIYHLEGLPVESTNFDIIESLQENWPAWIQRHIDVSLPALHHELARVLLVRYPGVKKICTEIIAQGVQRFPEAQSLLVRGSLKSEDFENDQLAGVSPSTIISTNPEIGGQEFWIAASFANVLIAKHLPDLVLAPLDPGEKLSLQIAPLITWNWHITALVASDDTVRLQVISDELLDPDLSGNRPMWLSFEVSSENQITATPSWGSTDNLKYCFPRQFDAVMRNLDVTVDTTPSFITSAEVLTLAKLARKERAIVGFESLDVEILRVGNDLWQVQMRPESRILGEVCNTTTKEGTQECMNSPFVLGKQFSTTGKILVAPSDELGLMLWSQDVRSEAFPCGDYILAVRSGDFAVNIVHQMEKHGRKFAGYIITDLGSELSHILGAEHSGETYFMRQQNYAAFPALRSSLELSGSLCRVDSSYSPPEYDETFSLVFQATEAWFRLVSDGRRARLFLL